MHQRQWDGGGGRGDPEVTRQRILDAAEAVFARDGLRGATTRVIAREAGVNEVTLFRHFQSRELLLAAAMQRAAESSAACLREVPPWKDDLRAGMLAYARALGQKFRRHEALCRAYVAEANLLSGPARQSISRSGSVTRQHAAAQVRAAQETGVVRRDLDPRIVADAFTDALIVGSLRSCTPLAGKNSSEALLLGTIEIFARGMETVPAARKGAKAKK